jgi:hypothetical protein
MAVFSGRVIGTLILGHFLTQRAGRPGPRIRARMHYALRCKAHPPLEMAIGSGAIAIARTMGARRFRSGSWRRSVRR